MIEHLQLMLSYNQWANAQIMDRAALVTPEQFIAPAGVSHGSLRGTLVHLLSAEWIWRMRCQGVSPTALLKQEEFPTVDSLQIRWQEEAAALQDFVAGLTAGQLQQTIHYRTTGGVPKENVLWHILAHLFNHGTQHRSEAAVLLTDFGQSPGDLDLILYLRR
jgi:uncharacterized damage-inducible protein DinB